MKTKKDTKQQYNKIIKLVNAAEKKANEFIRKNLVHDPELQIQSKLHRLSV